MRVFQMACLAVGFGLLSATASSAQSDPNVALAGRDGSMTCALFTSMSPGHRAAIVRGLNNSAPPVSIAGSLGGLLAPRREHKMIAENTSPNVSLTAGALVAACEAASPGESLRSAYDAFGSGRGLVVGHRRR